MNPVAAKAAGYQGIIGYVSQDTSGKNWTQGTLNGARAAGMDVGVVFEYAPQAARHGASQGVRDAGIAVPQLVALGFPFGVCCYAAVDWDVQSVDLDQVRNYALGFQSHCEAAGYRAGIYGGYAVCQMLHASGYTGLLWQTYAWSGGRWADGLAVRQVQNAIHVAGATVDRDTSQMADWGQWSADGQYPQGTDGGAVSDLTDRVVDAWRQGIPATVDATGKRIDVAPVTWELNREAWEKQVTATLATIVATLATLGATGDALTSQESADLHVIAEDLRKLTG